MAGIVTTMESGDFGVADLMLDHENPRHEPVRTQRDAVNALLDEGGDKIVKLAEDIVAHGMNPSDNLLILRKHPRSSTYIVVEGNRRLAAVKLLHNPGLASRDKFVRKFRQLAAVGSPPDELRCSVVASRQEAKHWQLLRHGGERGGVGVIPWSTVAAQRFGGKRGNQADYGMIFADAVAKAYQKNTELQDDITAVRKDKITTLGRLVQDPEVRTVLGFQFSSSI